MNTVNEIRRQDIPDTGRGKIAAESSACDVEQPARDKAASMKMDALLAEIRNLLTQAR